MGAGKEGRWVQGRKEGGCREGWKVDASVGKEGKWVQVVEVEVCGERITLVVAGGDVAGRGMLMEVVARFSLLPVCRMASCLERCLLPPARRMKSPQ